MFGDKGLNKEDGPVGNCGIEENNFTVEIR